MRYKKHSELQRYKVKRIYRIYTPLGNRKVRSARGEALRQPPIWQPFECVVYLFEAKRLFHHIKVWNSWSLGWIFAAISQHSAAFLFVVFLFEPLA